MQLQYLTTLFAIANAYSLCNKDRHPHAGKSVSAPLVPTSTTALNVNDTMVAVTVSGTIEVVDGCTFSAKNLVVEPSSVRGQWFGGAVGSTSDGIRLSADPITASSRPSTKEYKFITTAGSWVSYTDFQQFRLYDTVSKAVLATADLPISVGSNPASPPGSAPGAYPNDPKATGTAQAPKPTTTNGSIMSNMSVIWLTLVASIFSMI
ncbi:hypothetical protein BC833DRAFT_573022 [Globomyces pollinis-pini]|nr:hypothetical protein BC833DRAFT_573022 [Globomyces pollinis-pini]